MAFTPGAVSDEPSINTGQDNAMGANLPANLRGDIAVQNFWKRGVTAIFNVQVTDTDAPSARGQDPMKILSKQECKKKDKYLVPCLERQCHFTPLVFLVDGLQGVEATAACKRLAVFLFKKWSRNYLEVCGFVHSCISLSLAWTTSLCLHGSQDPTSQIPLTQWDSGLGLGLYHY